MKKVKHIFSIIMVICFIMMVTVTSNAEEIGRNKEESNVKTVKIEVENVEEKQINESYTKTTKTGNTKEKQINESNAEIENIEEKQTSESNTEKKQINNNENTEEKAVEIPVTELDLGDYQNEMVVGDKQLLAVTILPMDATEQSLSYNSSNTKVATINGMGRITAIKRGQTKITVSCGKVTAHFELTVKEQEDTKVSVRDLDLGDCPKEITIGTSQILSVAVIPADATETSFIYQSNNAAVASVNELGRLMANQLGTAEITVSCGDIKKSFTVTVVEDETVEKKVEVTDVEIGDYEEELEVDGTLNLTATVLPNNATDSNVTYKSSNPAVATINSSGEVKGIAPGKVIIYVSAGKVTKEVPVTVKIGTTAIQLNSNYCVMKPGNTYTLKASVQPSGAEENITYQSINPDIAQVNSSGIITAKKCGNTAIIVSNGELQVSVTVIVNEEGKEKEKHQEEEKETSREAEYPEEVNTKEYEIISKEMLKYFYETKKVLTIKDEDYTIYIDGKDIVNFENEFQTDLYFQKQKKGFTLEVNKGKKLCGKITIDISKKVTKEKHLYLYNKEKQIYQKVAAQDMEKLIVDTAGKYLLSETQINGFRLNILLIVIGVVAIVIGVGVYIGVKKQYWFW